MNWNTLRRSAQRTRLFLLAATLASAACAAQHSPTTTQPPILTIRAIADDSGPVTPTADAAAPAAVRTGVLYAYAGLQGLGGESYSDDGRVLRSDVRLGPNDVRMTLSRSPAVLTIESNGQRTEAPIPDGAIALPNGLWQAYAIAAERFPNATTPTRVRVVQGPGTPEVQAEITVRPSDASADAGAPAGTRIVHVDMSGTVIRAMVAADGTVRRVEVPSQDIVVLPRGEQPPPPPSRAPPAGVLEEPVEVTRTGVVIRGSLWIPANAPPHVPAVLILAGSGPTDRDGNNRPMLHSDMYRQLATSLAQAGIASLRFDKRGVAASGRNFDPSQAVFDDVIQDAAAMLAHLRGDARIGSVTVAGHSEGGHVALHLATAADPPGALVLMASPGRSMATLFREQLNREHSPAMAQIVDDLLAALRAGQPLPASAAPFAGLFAPAVQRYVRSELDLDPATLMRRVRIPTVVIQGTTDAQVLVADAQALVAARRGTTLVMIPNANHLFKEETSSALPQRSYQDPSIPLMPAFVQAVVRGVRR